MLLLGFIRDTGVWGEAVHYHLDFNCDMWSSHLNFERPENTRRTRTRTYGRARTRPDQHSVCDESGRLHGLACCGNNLSVYP